MSERTRDGNVVLSYLNEIGLKPSRTLRQFWADLERRHGKSTVAQLQQLVGERTTGLGESLYSVKNRDLRLSLDFAAYSADLYRRFFDWWVARWHDAPQRNDDSPRCILDLGCDNGIVTCFLALLHPDAQVLGIDREPTAIRCAESLADRLGLPNVTFRVADLQSPDWMANLTSSFNHCDRVVSIRSFHELLGPEAVPLMEGPPHFSTLSLIETLADQAMGAAGEASHRAEQTSHVWPFKQTSALLSNLVQHMTDEAEWVSFDRLTTMKSVTSCTYLFHTVGLEVDWDQATWIPFYEVGDQQSMPILVYRKRLAGQPFRSGSSVGDASVGEPADLNVRSLRDGVYRLYAPGSGGQGTAFSPGRVYKDEGAEVLFERLDHPLLLVGYSVLFPGQSETRIELYESDNLLFVYQRTASGYRQLDVHSPNAREELLHYFTQTMPNTFTAQGTSYHRY